MCTHQHSGEDLDNLRLLVHLLSATARRSYAGHQLGSFGTLPRSSREPKQKATAPAGHQGVCVSSPKWIKSASSALNGAQVETIQTPREANVEGEAFIFQQLLLSELQVSRGRWSRSQFSCCWTLKVQHSHLVGLLAHGIFLHYRSCLSSSELQDVSLERLL